MLVVAWVTLDGAEATGRRLGRYGERAELRVVPRARAVVWLREWHAEDLARAQEHADRITDAELSRVFQYATDEEDPLGKAKAEVLAEYEQKESKPRR